MKSIPGINRPAQTQFAVLKPPPQKLDHWRADSTSFTRWMSEISLSTLLLFLFFAFAVSSLAFAQSNYSTVDAFDALLRWMPFLLKSGFFF